MSAPWASISVSAQIINTIAGNDTAATTGDGGPATAASLKFPYGICSDWRGNLLIADFNGSVIRKINAAGVISTVAGNGSAGFSGDGGHATAASLNKPMAVAVDNKGNFYIADYLNDRIRKVDSNGVITTVAGCSCGSSATIDGISATTAHLTPIDIHLDNSGNIFITDDACGRIRKIDTTGIVRTVVGSGVGTYSSGDGMAATDATLAYPIGFAVDASGNIYVADTRGDCIRKVSASTGIISTIAGITATGSGFSGDGGNATASLLFQPNNVILDRGGNIYIADAGNHRIRKIDSSGIISTVAGIGTFTGEISGDGGPATAAEIAELHGICLDTAGSTLYLTDVYRIRKMTIPRVVTTTTSAGSPVNANNLFAIYPNPNNGEFRVDFGENVKDVKIIVSDVIGQLVRTIVRNGNNRSISVDLGNTPPGTYLLKAYADGRVYTSQLIIK